MDASKTSQPIQEPRLLQLVEQILSMHEAEVDCLTCGEQIDCLAELAAGGLDPKKLLPAVTAHLECCADCREEFEALVCILRAQQAGQC